MTNRCSFSMDGYLSAPGVCVCVCMCVSEQCASKRSELPLLFGIKMASVLFLALCWTHGFINSRGSAGDTCRGSSLPPAESQCLHVTSIHRRPTPGHSGAAPSGAQAKRDGTQIEGVRKSVSGVKHNTGSLSSMSSPADTVRCCKVRIS